MNKLYYTSVVCWFKFLKFNFSSICFALYLISLNAFIQGGHEQIKVITLFGKFTFYATQSWKFHTLELGLK